MPLSFSNRVYFEKAMNAAGEDCNILLSPASAFSLLINGIRAEQLDNLCGKLSEEQNQLSPEEWYSLIQSEHSEKVSEIILRAACSCISEGLPLGSETIPGRKTNTSDYIGHCLLSGKVCGVLAATMNLDPQKAQTMGILHDYGRRETHTFAHTVRGFELLYDMGYKREAIACLTHSFHNGGRCTNLEPTEAGFYLDREGNPGWKADAEKDEIGCFLERYVFSDYDKVLNMSDLMAASRAVLSPAERVADIITRRVVDPGNHGFFLVELSKTLVEFTEKLTGERKELRIAKAVPNMNIEQIEKQFEEISDVFFKAYCKLK